MLMKVIIVYVRTGPHRDSLLTHTRPQMLQQGWQRLYPNRPYPGRGVQYTAQGQPYLLGGGMSCSFSHAQGLSVLACAPTGRIGVDLAHPSEALLATQLGSSFFTSAEQLAISQGFFTPLQLWTRKEAVLKAAGCGLLLEPVQAQVATASCTLLGHTYSLISTGLLVGYELSFALEFSKWALKPLTWEATELN
jgi:phosphopantetheinyl transferase